VQFASLWPLLGIVCVPPNCADCGSGDTGNAVAGMDGTAIEGG
jgi:hypothetical protein